MMKYQTKTDKRGRLIEIHVPLEKQDDMFCRFNIHVQLWMTEQKYVLRE